MISEIDCITDYKEIKMNIQTNLDGLRSLIYYDSLDKFKITKQRDGNYPAIITISGFRSEDNDNQSHWKESILKAYPDREWFHLEWNAEKLPFDPKLISDKPTPIEERQSKFSKYRSKLKYIQLLTIPYLHIGISLAINNYWHLSVRNSRHTGICLANVLNACKRKEFIMIGHSLGARVIYNCMKHSNEKNLKINIIELHLLGGAVGSNKGKWVSISKSVKNNIYNYLSNNDKILRILYRTSMLTVFPIGLVKIINNKVINKDVTQYIDGHTKYIENFDIIKNYNSN